MATLHNNRDDRLGKPRLSLKPAPTTVPEDCSIFEFFQLPRELRDLIYAFALHDEEPLSLCDTEFTMQPRNVPLSGFLVLSRQFQQEYQSIANENSALELFDTFNVMDGSIVIPKRKHITSLPTPARHVSSVINRLCARTTGDMSHHMSWASAVLQKLPQRRNVIVTVTVFDSFAAGGMEREWWKVALGSWLRLPLLEKLEVFVMCWDTDLIKDVKAYDKFLTKESLTMRWTKEDGKWKDFHKSVEADKEVRKDSETSSAGDEQSAGDDEQ